MNYKLSSTAPVYATYITEISEEDFRNLNLKGYCHEKVKGDKYTKFIMKEVSLNDVLNKQIAMCYELENKKEARHFLSCPVTIAVHLPPTVEDIAKAERTFLGLSSEEVRDVVLREFSYLDKFMNRFTGFQTYQIGLGIPHLYITRDYFEAHDDYWRVKKSETKAIYRIHLDPKRLERLGD